MKVRNQKSKRPRWMSDSHLKSMLELRENQDNMAVHELKRILEGKEIYSAEEQTTVSFSNGVLCVDDWALDRNPSEELVRRLFWEYVEQTILCYVEWGSDVFMEYYETASKKPSMELVMSKEWVFGNELAPAYVQATTPIWCGNTLIKVNTALVNDYRNSHK